LVCEVRGNGVWIAARLVHFKPWRQTFVVSWVKGKTSQQRGTGTGFSVPGKAGFGPCDRMIHVYVNGPASEAMASAPPGKKNALFLTYFPDTYVCAPI